jgi:tRNA threonylcarbamoyladenosine biosynthesis protein TsaB
VLLAIDTATDMTGLALHDGRRVLAEISWQGAATQTVELAPQIAMILRQASLTNADLAGIALASGPGSYTGLRIGMAMAKGMALVDHLPLLPIPTLDILAADQPLREVDLLCLIRAGRGRYTGQRYLAVDGSWKPQGAILTAVLSEHLSALERPALISGELSEGEREQLANRTDLQLATPAHCLRRPAVLAELGWAALREARQVAASSLTPVYGADPSGKSD